jgi:cytochrome c-type biogenesis protein CcmH
MRRFLGALQIMVIAAALSTAAPALAVQPDEILPNAGLEARARNLSKELRCMVCQNQSIDDSDAPLARDLRVLVRERLVAGDSDAEVLDFLTARYGDFVLLKPRLTAHTALLWLAPFAIVLAGVFAVIAFLRRRRDEAAAPAPAALSPDEQRRIAELLKPSDHR